MILQEILPSLHNLKKSGQGFTARCPSHDDKKNSLSIKELPDKIVLHCFAGCSVNEVCDGIGIEVKDLFHNYSYSKQEIKKVVKPNKTEKVVAVYQYKDEKGCLLYENVRFEPKRFLHRHFDENGKEVWALKDIRRVLYRLPELLSALNRDRNTTIFLTEGEKDCDNLRELGFTASSFKNWKDDFNNIIQDANIVIFQDHDKSGLKQANDAATLLNVAAKSIKIIDFFENETLQEKDGKDFSDWLRLGHTKEEIEKIVSIAPVYKTESSLQKSKSSEKTIPYPVLSKKALHGLVGEIIRTIEPHTEADPAALLIQLLAGFGNLIGMTAHFRVGADFHYTKIFSVLVGGTAKGRKGTSWNEIQRLLLRADSSFKGCVHNGLSSGEGLIHVVRDPVFKKKPLRGSNKEIIGYEDEMVDPGEEEKRAFIIEPEFARVLKVISREGNTLSSIIRQSWDTDYLRVMTKSPLKATGAHISIIGHITKEELARNLDETETANGFANRFLWMCVRRSKYLPDGGNLQDSDLDRVAGCLNIAMQFALSTNEIKRDEESIKLWHKVYKPLSDGHNGLLGSTTSRATAQVLRLASLYALLDLSNVIRLEHLEAALALYQYSEDSAKYIFGMGLGDKAIDEILIALQNSENGLTKTEISELFSRNRPASKIENALNTLLEIERIEKITERTDGRPREIFRAIPYEINEKYELKHMSLEENTESESYFVKFVKFLEDNIQIQIPKIFTPIPCQTCGNERNFGEVCHKCGQNNLSFQEKTVPF